MNDTTSPVDGSWAPAAAPEPIVHPVRAMLRALRGRVIRTLVLAAVLGVAGAAAGWRSAEPEFEATGMLRVAPSAPSVLRADDDAPLLPPFFEAFSSTQASYLSSRPVLARAVAGPALAALHWPVGDEGVDLLARAVKVDRQKGAEIISVIGTGRSPDEAAAVVNGVLSAYDAVHGESGQDTVSRREKALADRDVGLVRDLAANEAQVLETGGEFEAQSLAKAHLDKVAYLQELERRIAELDDSIAQQAAKTSDGDLKGVDEAIMRLTVLDNAMAGLLLEHAKHAGTLAALRETYTEKVPRVQAAVRQLEIFEKAIEDRRAQLTLLGKNGVLAKRGDAGGEESLAHLRTLRDSLVATRERVRKEAMDLNRKSLRLGALEAERTRLQGMREETRREVERVRTESRADLPGRVSVAVWASAPTGPARDRRKAIAALGGLLGAFGAVGATVLAGLLSRRVRWSDGLEAFASRGDVLGVLPWLVPDRPASREAYERAARQAAQVLEVRCAGRREGGIVIAVTGAGRSGGKTTVATALAAALARARLRTVLVDADVGVRGATARFGQLDAPGLSEALAGTHDGEVLHATSWDGLFTLPAGRAADGQARLSRAPVATLLEGLRAQFDAVVVDAGAVDLGLEGGLVAAVADETIVVVGAGQPKASLEGALRLLDRYAGGRTVRFMFHGALRGDPGLAPAAASPSFLPDTLALPEPA